MMNSTTSDPFDLLEGEDDSSDLTTLHRYATFICSVIMCVCCVVGFFGNGISLVIFTHRCMRSPINVLLAGLALVDLCVVLFAVPVFVTPGIGAFYFHSGDMALADDPERQLAYSKFVDRLYTINVFGLYQLNMIANTSSVWTCVVICSERYLAVCKPFVAQRYSTVNRAKAVQISVFAAAILYNLIRFFEYEPDDSDGFKRRLRDDAWYIYIYYTTLYLATHFVGPFIFILATNILILRELRRAHDIRRLMTGNRTISVGNTNTSAAAGAPAVAVASVASESQPHRSSTAMLGAKMSIAGFLSSGGGSGGAPRQSASGASGEKRANAVQQQQTSRVIVVVTIMFTVCNSLSFIISIWEAFQLDLFMGKYAAAAFLLLDLSNVLVVFNSATTFLFYLRYCTKYRKLFFFYCANMATFCKKLRTRTTTNTTDGTQSRNGGGTGGGSGPRLSTARKFHTNGLLSSSPRSTTNGPELTDLLICSSEGSNRRSLMTTAARRPSGGRGPTAAASATATAPNDDDQEEVACAKQPLVFPLIRDGSVLIDSDMSEVFYC